jgi:hypothetical protein
MDPFLRGRKAEDLLGRNLHPNFPVIDVDAGHAVASIKSIDLAAPTYQSASRLKGRLDSYARHLARPSSNVPLRYAGETVDLAGKQRVLLVAIPRGATVDQMRAFSQATQSAAQQKPSVLLQFVTLE